MCRPIRADKPRTVDGKAHRQLLDRHVMDNLVVSALQERRVDRRERLVTLRREPCGKRHAMLLSDTHIERPIRELLAEQIEPGPRRHGRRHRDDPIVLPCFLNQAFRKHFRVARRVRRGLHKVAGHHIELADTVVLILGILSRRISLALLGHHVNEDRSFASHRARS